MKTTQLIALCVLELPIAAGQQATDRPGLWRNFTDMRNVRAMTSIGGVGWAATEGGLFRWEGESITKYTNAEGLSSNDLTAVMVDPTGRIWVGTDEGSVNVLERGSNQWIVIDDILNSTRTQKGIRTFVMSGDSLFIGTDFGVSVFRLSRWEFGDTYANFGFAGPAAVNGLEIKDDRLWIATNQGVASAQRFSGNLSAPTSWTRYQTAEGLPANNVTDVEVFHDTVVVSTTSGVAYYDGSAFQQIADMAGRTVVALHAVPGELRVLIQTAGYQLRGFPVLGGSSIGMEIHPTHIPTALAYDPSIAAWFVGTSGEGIDEWSGNSRSIEPNGPSGNHFSSLAVDGNGVLWYATGISGSGFGRYNAELGASNQWKNFTVADYPAMVSNNYYKISLGANNRMWASSWGNGIIEVVADTIRRRLDAASVPALASSVTSGPPFVVIGSVGTAPDGTDWIINRTAVNGNYLAGLVSDTSFSYMTNGYTPGQGTFTSMVVDDNGTRWLANAEPFNKPATGLYYVNEKRSVSGTLQTGGWGLFTTSEGLPNNTILSLAVDVEGFVCIGTDLGLMLISDPLFPKQRHFSSFPLREQSIQALAVDALNNKWVGTKEGVFVMNADATQILQQYTTTSTGGRLVDNDIRALTIDKKRGIVYIGTEKGISSLTIEAVTPLRSATDLTVGPNPFTLPAKNSLVIGNLVAESSVKILTVDGKLVTEFKAQGGGRAFWDGRDHRGDLVGSGVYFVVAFAENGDQVGKGKVAVIRR